MQPPATTGPKTLPKTTEGRVYKLRADLCDGAFRASSDCKIQYNMPGCLSPRLTPSDQANTFFTYNFYAAPPPASFANEFVHYFFGMVHQLIVERYECLSAGLDTYVARCKRPDLADDEAERLQKLFRKTMSQLDKVHKDFKARLETACESSDSASSESAAPIAQQLVNSLLELLVMAFFTVLSRVSIAWQAVRPAQDVAVARQSCPLFKLSEALLERGTALKDLIIEFGTRECTDLFRKNVGDEAVLEYLARQAKPCNTDEEPCPQKLYVPVNISDFFEDLVIYTYHVISSEDYRQAHDTIDDLFGVASQTNTSQSEQPKLEPDQDKAEAESKPADEAEGEALYGRPVVHVSERKALDVFLDKRAAQDEASGASDEDLLNVRGAEFERIKRMIEELINKYN